MKNRFFGLFLLFAVFVFFASCGIADEVDVIDETEVADEIEAVSEIDVADELEEASGVDVVEYIRITPQKALEMMENEDVVVLDVRSLEEFEQGHIPGAILLTGSEVRENASNVIPDKHQIILVYCRSGRRSEGAARVLIDLGYTRVYDFGGMTDWIGEIVYD